MSKERYTPGLWQVHYLGGQAYKIASPLAQQDEMIAVVTTGKYDARLIAEAPNLFQLVKQGLDLDKDEERQCPCHLCEAGRAIIARVLEGEENAR